MSLYWRAQILVMCLSALIGGGLWIKKTVHDSHTLPVQAVVSTIDRTCEWKDNQTGAVETRSCTHDQIEGGYKRTAKTIEYVEGDAVIHFTYLAPQDMVERPGELKLTGKDPRFYSLTAGDPLPIRIDKDDAALYEIE